jgi:hypothetical protein
MFQCEKCGDMPERWPDDSECQVKSELEMYPCGGYVANVFPEPEPLPEPDPEPIPEPIGPPIKVLP